MGEQTQRAIINWRRAFPVIAGIAVIHFVLSILGVSMAMSPHATESPLTHPVLLVLYSFAFITDLPLLWLMQPFMYSSFILPAMAVYSLALTTAVYYLVWQLLSLRRR